MRVKEDRMLATIVLVVVIVASIFLGGGFRLNGEREKVVAQFNAASESISAELKELSDNAYVMLGIAREYAGDELAGALEDALSALDAAETIGEKSEARTQLNRAVEDVYTALSSEEMTQIHTDDLRYKYKNYSSANLRISHDTYNDQAAAFNQLRSGFPAKLIAASRGIQPLEAFN